jgi:hypothetical protein
MQSNHKLDHIGISPFSMLLLFLLGIIFVAISYGTAVSLSFEFWIKVIIIAIEWMVFLAVVYVIFPRKHG